MKVTIVDCYTDEPAGLGVPPYLNTYPRYVAGAVEAAGAEYEFLTIDDLRAGRGIQAPLVVVIAGIHTPGRYLNRRPGTLAEVRSYLPTSSTVVVGGPAALGSAEYGGQLITPPAGYDYIVTGDLEQAIYDLLTTKQLDPTRGRDPQLVETWARAGARLARLYPDFPWIVAEIETYRGCKRQGSCSFCTEALRYGRGYERATADIIAEITALHRVGVRAFRLGKQACFYSYGLQDGQLQPTKIEALLDGIRQIGPLQLWIDNADPAIIARQPAAAREITRLICRYCTPGSAAALGMESADPAVIAANHLGVTPDEVLAAIRLINQIGAERGPNGMPKLLPGLNFVCGLMGESKRTFELNLAFLRQVRAAGLLLRRINLRQVAIFPGTRMAKFGPRLIRRHKLLFKHFKYRVRTQIDQPLLRQVFPHGTVLTRVRIEKHEGKLAFGRQLGSYPLLVGIWEKLPLGSYHDVVITEHGQRSVGGVPYPLDWNHCSLACLEALPGIGHKTAVRIVTQRPLSRAQLAAIAGEQVLTYIGDDAGTQSTPPAEASNPPMPAPQSCQATRPTENKNSHLP